MPALVIILQMEMFAYKTEVVKYDALLQIKLMLNINEIIISCSPKQNS